MRHHSHILVIVMPDRPKIVAEWGTALAIVLLIVGKAAGERMPTGINDLRVWQEQVDQRRVKPIVWRLVDEEWPVALSLAPGPLEIFFTERFHSLRLHFGDVAVISSMASTERL